MNDPLAGADILWSTKYGLCNWVNPKIPVEVDANWEILDPDAIR